MLVVDKSFEDFDPRNDDWSILWFSSLRNRPDSVADVLHKLAVLSRNGKDVFSYLKALQRKDKLASMIKYLRVDKVGAFGIFIDVEAIIGDIVGAEK